MTCDKMAEHGDQRYTLTLSDAFNNSLRHFFALSDAAREISKLMHEPILFHVRKDHMEADGLEVRLVDETAIGHDPRLRIALRGLDPTKEFGVLAQDKDKDSGPGSLIMFKWPYDHMSAKRFNLLCLNRDKAVCVIAL